jgi:uncharacterized protein YhhL (DUF1145 family)
MVEKIKNNWLVILINLVIAFMYIYFIGFNPVVLIVETVFLIGFYFKILKGASSTSVTTKDGKLIVNGVFHNLEIEQEKVADLKFKRNLLANIFDWDLMIIKTQHSSTRIYVRRGYKMV